MSTGVKSFLVIVIIVIVAAAGIYLAKLKTGSNNSDSNSQTNSQNSSNNTPETAYDLPPLPDTPLQTDIIFFYGSTCPHCKKVEQFFADTQMDKRVKFDQKEVYGDQANAQLMTEKQNQCKNLAEDDKGGVPFMYSSQTCIVGDQPIIDYFMQLTGITKK